jgi:hypothetical protein
VLPEGIFANKIPIFVYFIGHVISTFMVFWYLVLPFGIVCCHLLNFHALVGCTKKNLATLIAMIDLNAI